jgi:hypothetical protein
MPAGISVLRVGITALSVLAGVLLNSALNKSMGRV